MLIAILKYKGKKLFIEFLNPKKSKEYNISCFRREKNRRIPIGILEYTLKANEIYIGNMNVKIKFQRKGYGRILINFVKGIAQASNLSIRVFSLSEVIGFYKKCGFKSEVQDSQDMIWGKRNVGNNKTKKNTNKSRNKKTSH